MYLFALKEHADEKRLDEIERALTPPKTYRHKGRPAWFDDDEASRGFDDAPRRKKRTD